MASGNEIEMTTITKGRDVLILRFAVFNFWVVTSKPSRAAFGVNWIKIRENDTSQIAISTDSILLSGLEVVQQLTLRQHSLLPPYSRDAVPRIARRPGWLFAGRP